MSDNTERAVLAAGCFWGVQELLRARDGVLTTRVGYTGGKNDHPTTKDRQGNDIGSSYRSEVFFTSEEQRQVAEDTIADVDASGLWPGKVATEISEAPTFWEAEPEHQDYLQRYPDGYSCHYPRPGWKLPHRETAA
jgi:peptide-methionine (S)-S-oxide reductase